MRLDIFLLNEDRDDLGLLIFDWFVVLANVASALAFFVFSALYILEQ